MNKRNLTIKIKPMAFLISFCIFLIPFFFSLSMNTNIPLIDYWDEIITVISIIYCFYLALKSKLQQLEKIILILFFIILSIGLLSNLVSKISLNYFSIIVDAIALAKIPVNFVAAKHLASTDYNKNIVNYLIPISKIFIICAFIFGTISLFVNIGMSGDIRYGIPSFWFIFKNQGRLGFITAASLLIILIGENRTSKTIIYQVFAFLVMFYTTKGTIYIVFFTYLVLMIMWRKRKNKLSFSNILTVSVLILLGSSYQIDNYLRDSESPRMLFLKYGLVTANNYFPLGAGFSTYGSAEAAKQYSPLYYSYGFDSIWGLNIDYPMFLNDCYLGMVLGQFGYFGTLIFFLMFVLMFVLINNCLTTNKQSKALVIGMFSALLISAIGSAIIKSEIGVFCIIILGVFVGYYQQELNGKLRNKNLKLIIK